MTIKLNEFDKKLLSQITPASKWDKLKSIYAINSVVKQLGIGNKKIGTKCAKHLQKLSKQDSTNINEIREGCIDLRIKKKQTLPLAKDKTKRPVESTHKINKVTEKAPTGKTSGGSGGKGGGGGGDDKGGDDKNKFRDAPRKTGRGVFRGAPQPQADLIGGLFNAFKAQQAKQAIDTQYNQLEAERRQNLVNQQIPQGAAGDALRQRMQGRAAQQTLDALREGSNITGLSEGERLLYQELRNQRLNQQQARPYSITGQSMSSEGEDLLRELENKIYAARKVEQDLTNVSIPPTPRTSALELRTQQLANVGMINPTQEEKNQLAMDLLEAREQNLSSVQASVKRKQEMLKEKVAEADIYAEQQRQSMIRNKIGLQTENYINKQREEIKSNVLNKNMNHKEAQKKLQQLNTFYLKQLEYDQQQRVNKNIFNDIEEIERDRQFRLKNRKEGVDSVLSRLRNRESQEKQDRLVNDLIINQNEKRIQDIQSDLLGAVSSRAERKENRQQQIDLLRARIQNQSVQQQENQGFTFNPPTNPDLSSIQQNVLTNVGDRVIQRGIEQENTLGNLQLGVMDRASGLAEQETIFNQRSQPLGLTRTSSLSLLERMEADSLRQLQENTELQRTLSAGDTPSQVLDLERAKRKIKEQRESEAIFNRKQQELAQQIQNLEAEDFARPIEKKESPREKSFRELIAENEKLQDTLARIDAIEPMEDTMLEDIDKATKEVEKEKFRKVIDYKPLPTDDSNTADNYIAQLINLLNRARVGKSSQEEVDKVLNDPENTQIITRGAKAYQLKKLGKEELIEKDMKEKKRYRIEDYPEIAKDLSEKYYTEYAPEIDEMAEKNVIYEDSD
tara:strand:- start:1851 stop:4394 length:2544 start_codon:yes stop_codon:yes gene_type:complete